MGDIRGQRWAITGAAGRIGLPLREYLSAHGALLISIDISPTEPVSDADQVVQCDVADLATLESLFAGCAGVVHLGGLSDEADFHDLAEVNIVGTYHVLEAARRAGVARVVYASSNRATGNYDVGTTVDDSMPARPDGFYGASKAAGEALCRLYSDKFSLSTVAIRIGTYGLAPKSDREMSTWLSPGDALRAFHAAMTTAEHHVVFYAVSKNDARWWSLESGQTAGFEPVDNAAGHADFGALPPGQPQGGRYASVEYSLDRMRPSA